VSTEKLADSFLVETKVTSGRPDEVPAASITVDCL
jgi:hypothetical protein